MPRILLVKTSSLGDIVHNLPVASDIAAALPGAEIDWVVEENSAAIPRLHPFVRRVIPVALRRWRKGFWLRDTWRDVQLFLHELRGVRYDAVVDTQGLLKSALVTRAAQGSRYGLDWKSSREPLSLFFYDRTFRVPRRQQAVERNRALAAQALRYTQAARVDYGIVARDRPHPWLTADPYAVLIHATSASSKLWPEARWVALGKALAERGMTSVLPWGSTHEHERSMRLASAIRGSLVPPHLELEDIAAVFGRARCTIGVDTGLTHLAGALGLPTVGIYTATNPEWTGLYGCARALNLGGMGASPAVEDVLRELERLTR
jgi:heptosyltransferase-1